MTDRVLQNRRRGDRMQNALLSGALAMLIWIIQQLFSLGAVIADAQPRLAEIEVKVSSAYRASDARRDFADLDARIKRLERARWHEGGTQ